MIKNIFFDFDGVITESVNVKTDAFHKLYLPYGEEIAQQVVNHHKANGGMSRFEKFKLYHRDFLKTEISKNQIDRLAKKFSDLVKNAVIESSEVEGATSFLKRYFKKYKCFVITGTPTSEAREIIKYRGLDLYFKGVFGSPEKKDYWCKFILSKYNLFVEETVFVGDALADYNAATTYGITFFLREYAENQQLFSQIANIHRFKNYYEFEILLAKL